MPAVREAFVDGLFYPAAPCGAARTGRALPEPASMHRRRSPAPAEAADHPPCRLRLLRRGGGARLCPARTPAPAATVTPRRAARPRAPRRTRTAWPHPRRGLRDAAGRSCARLRCAGADSDELPQVIRSDRAHEREHSLEVQLPFLQTRLGSLHPRAAGRRRCRRRGSGAGARALVGRRRDADRDQLGPLALPALRAGASRRPGHRAAHPGARRRPRAARGLRRGGDQWRAAGGAPRTVSRRACWLCATPATRPATATVSSAMARSHSRRRSGESASGRPLVAPARRRPHPVRPVPARLPAARRPARRCASCASATATRWCSRPTAARPGSASTRSRRSRSTTSIPASSVLSFGTAGCNLACKFCQNWDISKSREMDRLMDAAIARSDRRSRAARSGCSERRVHLQRPGDLRRVRDGHRRRLPRARHRRPSRSPRATCTPQPRREFYAKMDAANVDLKAFTDEFYFKHTAARHLQPVLDTLQYLGTRPTSGSRSRRC